MRSKAIIVAVIAIATLWGCNKAPAPAANQQQATVTLKDGSTFSGTVTKNSTDEIVERHYGQTR